ncbi:acyltransferase family protein [Oryzihumus sp.]
MKHHPPHPHLANPHVAHKAQLAYFDVVRTAASQMVVVGHALNIFVPTVFMRVTGSGRLVTNAGLFFLQNMGVVLFFALSGFLISRSVRTKQSRGTYLLRTYVVDRGSRILVPMVPVLVLVFIADHLVFGMWGRTSPYIVPEMGLGTLAANATLLYNNPVLDFVSRTTGLALVSGPLGSAAPLWTVVIEWWIYLAFGGLVLGFVGRRLFRPALLVLVAGAVPVAELTQGSGLPLAWVIGMLYAFQHERMTTFSRRSHLGVVALGAGTAVVVLLHTGMNLYHPAVDVGIAAALLSLFHAVARDWAGLRTPVLSGAVKLASDYSYSLYLVHFSLLIYLQILLPDSWPAWLCILVAFTVANVAALAAWWLFERHYPAVGRRLRRLVGPRQQTPAPVA